MRAGVILLVAVAGSFAMSARRPASADLALPTPRLFKDSRLSLAIARAQGRRDIVLVVASVPGRAAALERAAVRMGGTVRFRDDAVGYLRVRLPLDSAVAFSELPDVEAAAADTDDSFPSRLPSAPNEEKGVAAGGRGRDVSLPQARSDTTWPPRAGDRPLRLAYSALRDIDADAVRAAHPTYDGRGVTIAVLDGTIDMLLPEFQTAYALDGSRVPKFADIITVTDPRDDAALNPQWVEMSTVVVGMGATAVAGGRTLTLPRSGSYRVGWFDERRFNMPSNAAYIDQDVDRNGNPAGDDGLFAVLWDEKTNDVWVDTDRDLSFADENAMTDYVVRGDVGVFGRDDPATAVRESIGFAVQTDRASRYVAILIGVYQHSTGIMGAVAGNPEPGGRLRGIAPGARLVSISYGVSNLHAAIEGVIRAFRHPLVDVIVFQQSVVMASIPYLLADGRHPISIIAARLTAQHGKLMFVPGSNTPGFGLVAEDGLGEGVVSVGGYQSRGSYLSNVGLPLDGEDHMHYGGLSHGPSGTGALKPDLLAPSGEMSTDVGFRAGAVRRGLFALPPGYSIGSGTSTATPMAAGAAALVISAARQRGLPHDAARLKAALQGSARRIPSIGAHEQGAGLVQVGAAIAWLEQHAAPAPSAITVAAPVRTALSHLLTPPHTGSGLFEREGWTPGDTGTRMVRLTRTSGPRRAVRYTLRLVGDGNTFTVPETIELPSGTPVDVPVRIAPRDWGAHSALLLVQEPGTSVPVQRILLTVVAARPLDAASGFRAETTIAVPRVADRGVFVRVPPGTEALVFSASSPSGPVRLAAISPERDHLSPCGFPPSAGPCAIARPMPGVWEINLAHTDITFDETVISARPPSRLKVEVAAVRLVLNAEGDDRGAREAADVRLAAENLGADVAGASFTGFAGSARVTEAAIEPGTHQVHEVVVPAGATKLRAVLHASDSTADLDLYLLDCTTAPAAPDASPYKRDDGGRAPVAAAADCTPRARAASRLPGGVAEVAQPAEGRWVVVIDAFQASQPVSYRLTDGWTHPRFGSFTVAASAVGLGSGARWQGVGHRWTAARPDAGRVPYAHLQITSPRGRRMVFREGALQAETVPLGTLDLLGKP